MNIKNQIIILLISLTSCTKISIPVLSFTEQYIADSINQDISDIDSIYLIYGTWNFIKEETYDSNWNITSIINKEFKVRFVHGYMLLDKDNNNIYDSYYPVKDEGDWYIIDRSIDGLNKVHYDPFFSNLYSEVKLRRTFENNKEVLFLKR